MAPTSRLARLMRDHLGEAQWMAFKAHADAHWRSQFLRAFEPADGALTCSGLIDGSPCPHGFKVHCTSSSALLELEHLHLNHTHDLVHVCEIWRRLVPRCPQSWCEGINGDLLCHLLFGTEPFRGHAPSLRFRCGTARTELFARGHAFCCATTPHYAHVLDAALLLP